MSEETNDAIIQADNGQPIKCKVLTESLSITLQRSELYDLKVSYPIHFMITTNGFHSPFQEINLRAWYIGIGPDKGDKKAEQFEITEIIEM
ncbi:hypothetical protein DLM76_20545 [Leptospira yasudae]|uniref:hypothetical protein n=1 Tax=Leptospira yasudae TaxID=2202201 RepID=UPI000E59EDC5|nr:hypothetical protein [Leptospira yasudae]RHX90255.1 hypothetical protein DLM76_20545 [Leptospira yasudae]